MYVENMRRKILEWFVNRSHCFGTACCGVAAVVQPVLVLPGVVSAMVQPDVTVLKHAASQQAASQQAAPQQAIPQDTLHHSSYTTTGCITPAPLQQAVPQQLHKTGCTTATTPQQAAPRQLHYNRLHHYRLWWNVWLCSLMLCTVQPVVD